MKYQNIREGSFISRPNRFVAHVKLERETVVAHVKNTGRCRELLLPGVAVGLVYSDKPGRKTSYDLVSVKKEDRWVNMDSQMVNDVAFEWLAAGGLCSKEALLKREVVHGASRFDFYLEEGERKIFLEVKGVTLEEDGTARFPDAPTKRGIKHIRELISCLNEGYEAYVLFVIQMKGVQRFSPNWKTHREFGEVLREAKRAGVKLMAYDCEVDMGSIRMDQPVPLDLEKER